MAAAYGRAFGSMIPSTARLTQFTRTLASLQHQSMRPFSTPCSTLLCNFTACLREPASRHDLNSYELPRNRRHLSTGTNLPAGAAVEASADDDAVPGARVAAPGDLMIAMFTCKVCETRTARTISKSSYTKGTVLVRCPGCRNSHVLADHLGFFDDHHVSAEKLLEAKGEKVRRLSLAGGFKGLAPGLDRDEHSLNLTEADLAVLRSRTKAITKDGKEAEVVPAQGILDSVERVKKT